MKSSDLLKHTEKMCFSESWLCATSGKLTSTAIKTHISVLKGKKQNWFDSWLLFFIPQHTSWGICYYFQNFYWKGRIIQIDWIWAGSGTAPVLIVCLWGDLFGGVMLHSHEMGWCFSRMRWGDACEGQAWVSKLSLKLLQNNGGGKLLKILTGLQVCDRCCLEHH